MHHLTILSFFRNTMARRRIAPRKRVTDTKNESLIIKTETIDLTIPKKRKSHEIIIDMTGIDIRVIEQKINRLETEQKDFKKICDQYNDEIESNASTSTASHETPDTLVDETEFKAKVKIEYLKQTELQEQKSQISTVSISKPTLKIGLKPKIENTISKDTKTEIQNLFVLKQLKIMQDISSNGLQNSDYTLSEQISALTYTLEKFHKSKKIKSKLTKLNLDSNLKKMFKTLSESFEFQDLFNDFWTLQETARKNLVRGKLGDNKHTEAYKQWQEDLGEEGRVLASDEIIIKTREDLNKKFVGPEIRDFANRALKNLKPDSKFMNPRVEIVDKEALYGGTLAVRNFSENYDAVGFSPGDIICEYPTVLVETKDHLSVRGRARFEKLFWMYLIGAKQVKTKEGEPKPRLDFFSVYIEGAQAQRVASSCFPCSNTEFHEEEEKIYLTTTNYLSPGDKLWINYGRRYWSNMNDVEEPECPVCGVSLILND